MSASEEQKAKALITREAQGLSGLLGHLLFVDKAIAECTIFQADARSASATLLLERATQGLEQAFEIRELIIAKLDDQEFNVIYSTLFDQ